MIASGALVMFFVAWNWNELVSDSKGTPKNLLANGGFEKAGGAVGAGWHFDEKKHDGKGTVERQSESAHEGKFALRISPAKPNLQAGDDTIGVGQILSGRPVRAQNLYVSAWMAAEGNATAVVGVLALKKDQKPIGIGVLTQASNGGKWVRQSTVVTVKDADSVSNVLLFAVAKGGSGSAYFDDVSLTNRPDTQPASDVDVESTEPYDVSIDVNAGVVIREIPRELFGTNIEWIDNGNGMIDPKSGRFDPDIVRLAKEAGVTVVRYPGGLFSDHFHWRDSIGPRDDRPKREHYKGGPSSKLVFGTNEAIEFAKEIGGELMITVNGGSGTPQEAAEWLEYVNVEKKANVRFWEIGNEIYMKSFDANAPPAFDMTPAEYGDSVVEFAKAMRAVDPEIQIGAIGADNFTTTPLTDHPKWTDTVLSRAGESIDFLAVHNGYAPLLLPGEADPRQVYLALLGAPGHIRKSLADVSAKIDKLDKKDAERIGIAVTEWGPFFQVGPDQPFLDHPKTMGSALFVASTFKVFFESPKMKIANFFKLSEPTFMGWIGPRGGKEIPKAPLLAMEIFTKHFGTELVESKTTSPTFSCPAVGLMPSVDANPWFEVVAAKGEKGRLYVVAINKHFSAPAKGSLSIAGFEPAKEATVWTLEGKGMDAHTGTELPRVPGLKWARQAEVKPGERMSHGGPDEVTLKESRLKRASGRFEYEFPPRSVTSIELRDATMRKAHAQ